MGDNNIAVYDKNFVSMMKTEIPYFRDESLGVKDAMGHWEFLKYKMRQLSMTFSKEKAVERKSKRISLENRVKQLEITKLINSNEELLEQNNKAKNELETLYDYITEGIILHTKTDWCEHGEKSSEYFLNLEIRYKSKSHLRKILASSSQETTNQTAILDNIRSY